MSISEYRLLNMFGNQAKSYTLYQDCFRSTEIFGLSKDSLPPSFIETKLQCYHKISDSPQTGSVMGIWPVFTKRGVIPGVGHGSRSKITFVLLRMLFHHLLCSPRPQLWSWLLSSLVGEKCKHIRLSVLQPVKPLGMENQIQEFIWGKNRC